MRTQLKFRLFALITFVNAVVGISLGGLLYTIWPEHYFVWFPTIPLFYWVTALIMTYCMEVVNHKGGDISITTYMIVRLCKFLLACIFMWLYATKVGDKLRTFGFTLMLFYFIYLTMETYIIYLYEKKRMRRENRLKNG
ncbi:MAG TPA: hypothetical protein DDZ04_07715 [Parabacteroides sp.]|nr:hypothetical protein [Parabacteroides sp.]